MAECSVNMEVSMLHIPGEFLYSPHSSNIDLIFSSDNKLYDNGYFSRYYGMESCADLNDIKDLFDNNNYVLVNYDENFKELKDAEPSTEKATEKATEKSTEKTTEKSDEKSTEKATTKTSEVSTEKATAKN